MQKRGEIVKKKDKKLNLMEVQRQELQGMPWVGAVQSPGPLLLLQSTQNALSTCRKMALSQKSKREQSWSKMKI